MNYVLKMVLTAIFSLTALFPFNVAGETASAKTDAVLTGAHTSNCKKQMDTLEVRRLVAALDAAAKVGPVWDNYTIANHPIILLAQTGANLGSTCARVWRFRRPDSFAELPASVALSTPLYGMWDHDPVGPHASNNAAIAGTLISLPPNLTSLLLRNGETRAVVMPASLRLDAMGPIGKQIAAMRIDPILVQLQLAVHESYHLHSQFPNWLDQRRTYAWPAWDVQPDRASLVSRCYGGEEAGAAQSELRALLDTWDLLQANHFNFDSTKISNSARKFIALRRARYDRQRNAQVPSPIGNLNCRDAEAIMELEEGVPQWIAYETALRSGSMNYGQAGRSTKELFYVTGVFELWIIGKSIGPRAMRRVGTQIVRTQSLMEHGATVFEKFEEIFEPNSDRLNFNSSGHSVGGSK